MLKEFRDFLTRGNLIELAVAFVLGVAFAAVIAALVENLLTPLIAAIFGEPDFAGLTFTINDSTFTYGAFINALIAFLLVAAAVFFVVVKPYNAYRARKGVAPATKTCPHCMNEIPVDARRCGFCTSELA
jgi:large conductance mechanosensitive channel